MAKRSKRGKARGKTRRRLGSLGMAAAIGAVLVAVVVLIVLASTLGQDGDDVPVGLADIPPRLAPVQGNVLGSPDAPVTIVAYSDFQCPYCAQAATGVVRQIEEDYLATGKAKLVFKHFAFEGEESIRAAQAAECAADQNRFWDYHDMLFLNQRIPFTSENLKAFARELGLDTASFNVCLDLETHAEKVAADRAEGKRRGVSGTPTFYVGPTQIVGAKPYDTFRAAIEDQLAAQQEGGS
ncbi:MAG: DsbA family protein [Dehalococcoidia bacterium]